MSFVDEVTIQLQSGNGGKGCESFNRRTDKKCVPNGGDGGDGGDIIIRSTRNMTDLYSFRFNKLFRAESGHGGSSNQMTGRNGEDLTILVPCGTTIINKENDLVIRDLVNDGDEVTAVRGGRGGTGNQHHNREATPGEPAQFLEVLLTLKLSADIFLIGNANTGKSLLMNQLTHSKAKVEDYPFSTQSPQLGTYETEDYRSLTLCELPSLIEGSSRGKALGNQFLKHLERAKMIFLFPDLSQDQADLGALYKELLHELQAYQPQFGEIPHFVVINKSDLPETKELLKKKKWKSPVPLFVVSAKTGEGLPELMRQAAKAVFHEKLS